MLCVCSKVDRLNYLQMTREREQESNQTKSKPNSSLILRDCGGGRYNYWGRQRQLRIQINGKDRKLAAVWRD